MILGNSPIRMEWFYGLEGEKTKLKLSRMASESFDHMWPRCRACPQ